MNIKSIENMLPYAILSGGVCGDAREVEVTSWWNIMQMFPCGITFESYCYENVNRLKTKQIKESLSTHHYSFTVTQLFILYN